MIATVLSDTYLRTYHWNVSRFMWCYLHLLPTCVADCLLCSLAHGCPTCFPDVQDCIERIRFTRWGSGLCEQYHHELMYSADGILWLGWLIPFFWYCSGSLRSVQFQQCNCYASPRGIHKYYNEVFPKVVLWLKLTDGHNMPWLMVNITGYNVIRCLECCPNGPGVRPCVLLPICWWNGTNPIIAGKLLTVQPALERRDVFR
jgi:hypothetical protein